MSELTAGPAVDCTEGCGLQPVAEREQKGETCPLCGAYAPAVNISVCPNPKDCEDEQHDFGNDMHVKDVGK